MVDVTLWFTLGTVGMLLGTAGLAYGSRWVPTDVRRRYWILVAVPGIAIVAYGLMALGFGGLRAAGGGTVFAPRYADWLLTTPLHVLYLGLLVGAAREVVGRAVALQAATIVLGFVAALVGGLLAPLLYVAGCLTFAGVIYYAFTDFVDAVEDRDDATQALYRKLRAFMIVLWLIYPVIWILAPAGTALMDIETTSLVVSYLDVVAKVGFGLIALNGQLIATSTAGEDVTEVATPEPDA
jgi:sensory rhodopsin